jgi:hypothetical protein
VDVEAGLASIEAIAARAPTSLLTSHFGPAPSVDEVCEVAAERIRDWAARVRTTLERDPEADVDAVAAELRELAAEEFLRETGRPIELERYDVIGSIGMNAAGLMRYWKRRWDREPAFPGDVGDPSSSTGRSSPARPAVPPHRTRSGRDA